MPSLILYSVSTGRFAWTAQLDGTLNGQTGIGVTHNTFCGTSLPGSNIPSEPGPEPEPEPEHPASPAPAPTLQSDQKPTLVKGNNLFGSLGTEICAACRKRKGRVDAHT